MTPIYGLRWRFQGPTLLKPVLKPCGQPVRRLRKVCGATRHNILGGAVDENFAISTLFYRYRGSGDRRKLLFLIE
jgi:hypothetical protein